MITANDLAKYKMFRGLSDEKKTLITEISGMRSYRKDDYIYESGDAATHLFIVDQGSVGMRKFESADNVGISFEIRSSGELFGAASFMLPQKYTLTAVCLEDCRILAMDAQRFKVLCEEDPEIGFWLMKKLTRIYFNRYRDASKNLYGVVQTLKAMTSFPRT